MITRGGFEDLLEPSWNLALNKIGVRSELFNSHSFTLPGFLGRIERRILFGPGVARIKRNLIRRVRKDQPDVTLFYQGHYFDRKTLEIIRPYTFITGYHDDDPTGPHRSMLRYRHLLPALSCYQGYHVIRAPNLGEFMESGVPRVKLLRHSYRPWLHFPVSLNSSDQRKWGGDIVFAGHWEDDMRVDCLSKAIRAGVKVRIFGGERYWKSAFPSEIYSKIKPVPKIFGEEYRKALCGAKIAVGFLSKWNRDDHGMRSFEIPACGVFLLSERTAVMKELYEEGREAEFFSSSEEFLDKVRYYLKHDEKRKNIAQAGYQRVISSGYDIYSRMRQWVVDVEQWRSG